MTATSNTRTAANKPTPGTDWEQNHRTLQRVLDLDLHLRREELKDALLDYEDAHPGNNLVGTKVYEFLRHCQNIVWKQLADLALKNPAEYAAWKNGERGHWPLETNNVAHGMLLRLSENRRRALQAPGAAVERTKSGLPVISDNVRRTVQNWRRKTTADWQTQSGHVIHGFPFFLSWTRLNRAGEPDPKGRGNVVGLVNMRWIFGPEWTDQSGKNLNDGGDQPAAQREKSSSTPPMIKTAPDITSGKKNEEQRPSANAEDVFSGSAHTPIEPEMKTAQQQGTLPQDSEQDFEKINVAPPPGPAAGAQSRSAALWEYLLNRLYAPLLGSDRIRHSAGTVFTGDAFRTYTAQTCLQLLSDNLHAARNAGDATLEEAETRLREAIDGQWQYLQDNPETWLLTPDKFLRTDRPHGTLLSALRLFVKADYSPALPPPALESEPDQTRKNRLYARLLSLGACRTHPGTFSRWYAQYGPVHLEACMTYMAQQAERRRKAGRLPQREFDGNRGGASAYFAGLIGRFDSVGLQRERELAERRKLKTELWQCVYDLQAGKNSPHLQQLRAEMSAVYHRMCLEADFRDAAIRDTNAYFHMQIEDFARPTIIVLVHYVLQQQNK